MASGLDTSDVCGSLEEMYEEESFWWHAKQLLGHPRGCMCYKTDRTQVYSAEVCGEQAPASTPRAQPDLHETSRTEIRGCAVTPREHALTEASFSSGGLTDSGASEQLGCLGSREWPEHLESNKSEKTEKTDKFVPTAEGGMFETDCHCASCAKSIYAQIGLGQTAMLGDIRAALARRFSSLSTKKLVTFFKTLTVPEDRAYYDGYLLANCKNNAVEYRHQCDGLTIVRCPGDLFGLCWWSKARPLVLRAVLPGSSAEAAGAGRFVGRGLVYCNGVNVSLYSREKLRDFCAGSTKVELLFI